MVLIETLGTRYFAVSFLWRRLPESWVLLCFDTLLTALKVIAEDNAEIQATVRFSFPSEHMERVAHAAFFARVAKPASICSHIYER